MVPGCMTQFLHLYVSCWALFWVGSCFFWFPLAFLPLWACGRAGGRVAGLGVGRPCGSGARAFRVGTPGSYWCILHFTLDASGTELIAAPAHLSVEPMEAQADTGI